MQIAEKLKQLVDGKGVTYTFISEKTGIPVNSISRSFLGKRKLQADEMVAICSAVGINPSDLYPESISTPSQ
ncbi:MAG: helix-turn-helix transcriptional regulator [Oscillospiraceae bacterium]|nr:helix-turn-helix transcriptional regulator [Oscillospiraceae bacterium]